MAQDPSHSKVNQQVHHHQQHHHHQQQQQHHHQHQQQQQHRRQHQHQDPNEIAHDEVCEEFVSLPYRKAYEMAEKFATTRIGQYLIARGDRLLKTIETTAKWSLPQDQLNDKLQRPMSWIPFLMVIVALRLVRVWISVAALAIGNAPVGAQDVVYFIQTRRRKLRALRLRGVKEIDRRAMESKAKVSASGKNSFIAQLKKVFSSAICRPGHHREPERRVIIHRGMAQESIDQHPHDQQAAKRPRAEESDCDLTVDELLNKYEHLNTDDDSDFVPNPKEASTDNSETSTASSESADEEEAHMANEERGTLAQHSNDNQTEQRRQRLTKTSTMKDSVELMENGNNETVTMPVPIQEIKQETSAEHENSEKAKKSYDNGPTNGVENREVDVALKFVLSPPSDVQNFNAKNSTNSEDGGKAHESAVGMQQPVIRTINVAAGAANVVPEITHEPEVDIERTEVENFAHVVTTSNNDSSPTLSAASSSFSLDSFNQNELSYATATSTPTHEIEDSNDIESTRFISISSSEDDFYSPIGTPPDFNAFQPHPLSSELINMPPPQKFQPLTLQKTISEPHIGENPPMDNKVFRGQMGQTSRRGPQNSQNGNGQSQPQRFRGRNRR